MVAASESSHSTLPASQHMIIDVTAATAPAVSPAMQCTTTRRVRVNKFHTNTLHPAMPASTPPFFHVCCPPSRSRCPLSRCLCLSLTIAKQSQPKGYYDMNNDALLLFCAAGDFAARKERLLREIMAVDNVSSHLRTPHTHTHTHTW